MKIKSFQVTKFRNVVDSGPIPVDESVTCLVGKNESGKSALIEALYLFNPVYDEAFSVEDQYPRWLVVQDRKEGDLKKHAPIKVTFELDDDDKNAVIDVLGDDVLTGNTLTVERKYSSGTLWSFKWDDKKAVKNLIKSFPEAVRPIVDKAETIEQIIGAIEEAEPDEEGDEGPTSEELQSVTGTLEEAGLTKNSVWQTIVDILRYRLPVFFRFTNYSTLPGRIDFRDMSTAEEEEPAATDIQTARALLRLAGTDLKQLGNEDYELRTGELEAVQIALTNEVFEYWKQNPNLEVLIDVDKETVSAGGNKTAVSRFLDVRLKDRRTGYSNNFSQRSSGFQWFFSFLAAFSEFPEKESPIVLLDEPALNLHGKAQADFLRFINERLAPSSPVIYTTHSPFMVEVDKLARARVVEDHGPPKGSTASAEVLASDPDSLFPLQAALGYDIAQNLFVGPHNLVVEGSADFIYLTVMSSLCSASGREALDDRWRILPAGGASNIPTFVSLVGPHLDVTVLADSDTRGMQRITHMIGRDLLAAHRLILATAGTGTKEADIEDLLTNGDYVKLYNQTFGASIKVGDLPKGNRITKRIEAQIGSSFDHGKVAETLLRHYHEYKFSDTTLDQFAALNSAINQTIST